MRKLLLVLLVCLATAALAHEGPRGSLEQAGGGSGGAANALQDRDGDTAPDYVIVSDYDGDGTLETADIAAAVAALTDTGEKYVYVLPGDYAGPAAALAGARGLIELDSNTTFECAGPDAVTIRGSQWISGTNPSTVERVVVSNSTADAEDHISVMNCGIDGGWHPGWSFDFGDVSTANDTIDLEDTLIGTDLTATHDDHTYQSGDGPIRLVAGSAALPTGLLANTDYWVIRDDADTIRLADTRAKALTGGAGDDVDITAQGTGTNHRFGLDSVEEATQPNNSQGLFFRGVHDLKIRGNKISNTYHTGIYVSSLGRFLIDANLVIHAGNYQPVVSETSQASLYLFANNTQGPIEGGLVTNNRYYRSTAAINTRGDDVSAGEVAQEVLFTNNFAENIFGACINLLSSKNMKISGFHCSNAGMFINTDNTAGNYLDQDTTGTGSGPDHRTQRIFIENAYGYNMLNAASPSITIGEYHDGFRLDNVTVDGCAGVCMQVEGPTRNFVANGLTLKNGNSGLTFGPGAAARYPAEGMTFTDVVIENMTTYAVQTGGGPHWSVIDGLTVRGTFSQTVIDLDVATSYMTLRNIVVDCTAPQYRGYFATEAAAAAYLCNALTEGDTLINGQGGAPNDCNFASGTGSNRTLCVCDGAAGTWTASGISAPAYGIWVDAAQTGITLENIHGHNCASGHTISGDSALTNPKISNIGITFDTDYYAGTWYPVLGAVSIPAGSTGVLIDGRTVKCVDNLGECMAGAEDDLAAGSIWVDDTCDAPCTNGATCIDTDAVTGSLQQCESAAWNVID